MKFTDNSVKKQIDMIVITMTNCPPKLRGDLTKWLCEISTGVYVGNLSARVRDALWNRVCENIRDGKATMVYNAANEQRLEFRTHNTEWKVCDFDGIKLMMHPKLVDNEVKELPAGFSNASKRIIASKRRKSADADKEWVFIDLETTGLDYQKNKIIEIGVVVANKTQIIDEWSELIKIDVPLSPQITELTRITDEMLLEGVDFPIALRRLSESIKGKTAVCYNRKFDIMFLENAFAENKIEFPIGKVVDVLSLARKRVLGLENYKLESLAGFFNVMYENRHRALADCIALYRVFMKLNEI